MFRAELGRHGDGGVTAIELLLGILVKRDRTGLVGGTVSAVQRRERGWGVDSRGVVVHHLNFQLPG
jgi:hypothetical protein